MPEPKDGRRRKPKAGPRSLTVLTKSQALSILRLRAAIKAARRERTSFKAAVSRVPIPYGGTRPTRFRPAQSLHLERIDTGLRDAAQALYLFEHELWNPNRGRWTDVPRNPLRPPVDDVWKLNTRVLQLEAELRAHRRLAGVRAKIGDKRYRDVLEV